MRPQVLVHAMYKDYKFSLCVRSSLNHAQRGVSSLGFIQDSVTIWSASICPRPVHCPDQGDRMRRGLIASPSSCLHQPVGIVSISLRSALFRNLSMDVSSLHIMSGCLRGLLVGIGYLLSSSSSSSSRTPSLVILRIGTAAGALVGSYPGLRGRRPGQSKAP